MTYSFFIKSVLSNDEENMRKPVDELAAVASLRDYSEKWVHSNDGENLRVLSVKRITHAVKML